MGFYSFEGKLNKIEDGKAKSHFLVDKRPVGCLHNVCECALQVEELEKTSSIVLCLTRSLNANVQTAAPMLRLCVCVHIAAH